MKIGIVGSGFVGDALVMQGVGREIVLMDNNADRAEASGRHSSRHSLCSSA
jgi:L-lactate dehydrogenase